MFAPASSVREAKAYLEKAEGLQHSQCHAAEDFRILLLLMSEASSAEMRLEKST